jgi:hypothetical protein
MDYNSLDQHVQTAKTDKIWTAVRGWTFARDSPEEVLLTPGNPATYPELLGFRSVAFRPTLSDGLPFSGFFYLKRANLLVQQNICQRKTNFLK